MAASGFPPKTPYSGAQPDLQNCSPYSTIIRRSSGVAPVVHQPLGRRVPGRRGRDRPVADQPEVERRVDPRGARREALGVAEQQVRTVPCGNRNQTQCDHTSSFSHGVKRPACRARAAAAASACTPPPISAIGLHGIGDPHAPRRAPRGRRSASCTRPRRPTSAARTSRRHAHASAGRATHSANGAAAAARSRRGGGRRSRRRTSGAATPAASTVTRDRADGGRAGAQTGASGECAAPATTR